MKESVLRTLVPIFYAILVNLGVVAWLGVDSSAIESLLTLVISGVIYVVLRYAEKNKAAFGWLLGYPSQPAYGEVPPNPPAEPYAAEEYVEEPYPGDYVPQHRA